MSGVGFWFVAQAPERNRDLIKLGILFKAAYAGIVFYYYFQGLMPRMWLPWAICDVLFMIAFVAALRAMGRPRSAEA